MGEPKCKDFFRKSIPHATHLESKLYALQKRGVEFKWGEEEQEVFDYIKDHMCSDTVLFPFDETKMGEVILITDASSVGAGCVMAIRDETGTERPCCWLSTSFTAAQRRMSASERECLAVKWACEETHTYTWGRRVRIITDHAALRQILQKQSTNSRLNKWSMALQSIDAVVEHRRGKLIPVSDMLSRLTQFREVLVISLAWANKTATS